MAAPPLVSIVIDNYNYGGFVAEAIDSALAQTYPRTEVIVVDDGSTDGSREIIAAYGDRVRPLLKDNGGQASAFNAGFGLSRGEVILFLDADDALLPTAVAEAVDCPEEPYDGRLGPGDIELRFVAKGPHDRGELRCLIEVTTGWFESRARNRQERSDAIGRALEEQLAMHGFGVLLLLPACGWSQYS